MAVESRLQIEAYMPLVKRYRPLVYNIQLAGFWLEPITLVLRKADWPNCAAYGYERVDRLLGMEVVWK